MDLGKTRKPDLFELTTLIGVTEVGILRIIAKVKNEKHTLIVDLVKSPDPDS